MKTTYKGEFNWFGEVHEMYCTANNERHAFMTFCYKLGRKLNFSSWFIKNSFLDKCKYKITEVKDVSKGTSWRICG